jgi:O-antigen biosynthesis protein WbqP
MKLIVDTVLAAVGLVLASPVLLVLIAMIRRDSPGPAIFRQMRVGRHERAFECYKLRTMAIDTPDLPTHLADGSRLTRSGRWLRATKLDELPQLWNVLKGEMSLVGPRPCLPSQSELIAERRARGVFELRPGITGLAQIEGIDMSDPVRLAEKDAEYLGKRSLILDAAIVFRTVFSGGGQGDRIRR